MAGHLRHDHDFTPFARVTDALWWFGFIFAVISLFRSDLQFRYKFVAAAAICFLIFSSPLGIGGLVQLPVWIVVGVFLIVAQFDLFA